MATPCRFTMVSSVWYRPKCRHFGHLLMVSFFRKWDSFFKSPNLPKKNIPKSYPELEISISRQLHFTVIGGKFKFQAQDSFLEYFFLRFGDLKNESHFLKKSHLYKGWHVLLSSSKQQNCTASRSLAAIIQIKDSSHSSVNICQFYVFKAKLNPFSPLILNTTMFKIQENQSAIYSAP